MSDPKKYTVGWICAIRTELVAAQAFLDETHEQPKEQGPNDSNHYVLGRMAHHNVVIACLPGGEYGTASAAGVAINLLRSFPTIRIGLMVGIGGGAPTKKHDIRLGDVVISMPSNGRGGVFQYDFGKTIQGQAFVETGFLNQPPDLLRTAVEAVAAKYELDGHKLVESVNKSLDRKKRLRKKYSCPTSSDVLYKSDFTHCGDELEGCETCGSDPSVAVTRPERGEDEDNPAIHHGLIASANQLMKDALVRDKLATEKGVLCFEMEAAGLMNRFPCIVIRGICDYSDTHKNKEWQGFAAMMAAAYAKDLLHQMPASKVECEKSIHDMLSSIDGGINSLCLTTEMVKSGVDSANEQEIRNWFSTTPISTTYNKSIQDRTPGTGQWLLSSQSYKAWKGNVSGLLWLYGAAGSGKTMLCSTVVQDVSDHVQHDTGRKQAFWYFRFSDIATQNVSSMVRSFIRQLSPSPPLASTQKLWKEHSERGSEPTLNELTAILGDIINDSKEVFVIIDALDECQQTSQLQERTSLLRYINTCLNRHKDNLHILVTSRVDHDIKSALEHYKAIKIEEWIDGDVRMYIEKQIHSGCLAEYQDSVKNKIKESLLSTKERRFRWVDLQIRRLSDCNTEDQIATALRTVPETLEDIYKEALEKVPLKDGKVAREILMWLCFSLRPMTAGEIAAAVGLLQPENALRICSTMLVTLIHEHTEGILQLAHFTVKEYLVVLRACNNTLEHQFTEESAQDTLARTTVSCLLESKTLGQSTFASPNRLLDYSARFWYEHAIILEGRDEYASLRKAIDQLFSHEYSAEYELWLKTYNPDNPYANPYALTKEKNTPHPLYYASFLGFSHSVRKLLLEGGKVEEEGRPGNAFLAAVSNGHESVVKEFLERLPPPDEVEVCRVIKVLRRNAGNILSMYLERYTFEITELILMAAVESLQPEILSMLRRFGGGEVDVPEYMVQIAAVTAAESERKGMETLAMLLDRKGEEIKITEKVVMAAAGEKAGGSGVMAMLLDRRGEEIQITEEVVMAALQNRWSGQEILAVLLDRKGQEIETTKTLVTVAAMGSKRGKVILTMLLERRGEEIKITEEVLIAAAKNERSGKEILTMLLDRKGEEIKITGEVVMAAANNTESGSGIMTVLLDRKGDDVKITDDMVEEFVRKFDKFFMSALLGWKGGDIKITEKLLIAAAKNEQNGREVLAVLVDKKGEEIKITAEVIAAVSENLRNWQAIMVLLLCQKGENIQITDDAVAEIARRFDKFIILLLLGRKGGLIEITEELMISAAENELNGKEILALLLDRKRKDIKITEGIMLAAVRNQCSGNDIVTLLLERSEEDIQITDELVTAAAENKRHAGHIKALLLGRLQKLNERSILPKNDIAIHDEKDAAISGDSGDCSI
ncbi:NACHT domain-containing protein [Pochonia chlamydosporia 170]|uniref:NACHT domain-containing protein n=1 Tax=Pochonia chlamydosporia 170 TaxID=1380566 RepID=A0A219APV1_METCM|nr:NACHT domain-containing protein [Pochonia chlamydosporia 170]OWT42731.1 NACHT domain-containing protein [Pochonia chlamydosporia 170]